jgi:hypothetical protein
VDIEIETNIPGDIEVSANLALSGQNPKDTFIGTQFRDVHIANGKGQATIDEKNDIVLPLRISQLPSGQYDVIVAFHPRWAQNKLIANKLGIKDSIQGKATIKLKASGISVESTKAKEDTLKQEIISKTKNLYLELIEFKGDDEFHRVGFGACCKYNNWLQKVEKLQNDPNAKLLLQEGVTVGDLQMLGLEYMRSKGKETEYSTFINKELKKVQISIICFGYS